MRVNDVGDRALEAEAKARMRHRAVAAQVPVPGVMLQVDAALGHARVEHREPLLALAASDDLADPGRQHVHRRHRPAVVTGLANVRDAIPFPRTPGNARIPWRITLSLIRPTMPTRFHARRVGSAGGGLE